MDVEEKEREIVRLPQLTVGQPPAERSQVASGAPCDVNVEIVGVDNGEVEDEGEDEGEDEDEDKGEGKDEEEGVGW